MKKTMVVLVVTLGVLTLAGCSKCGETVVEKGTSAGGKEIEVEGVYRLVAVNGADLPAAVTHGETEIKVHSGTFTIEPGGTCSSKIIFGSPSGERITRKVDATYSQEGSTLNMQWTGAGRTRGVVKGDTFEMNNEGMILSYKK